MRHMLIVDSDRDPDEPLFPLPRMDHELRYGNDDREGSNYPGCLAVIAFLVIFWTAVIVAFVLALK